MNKQPPEKPRAFDGYYYVHSIFHTLQGEGPHSGVAAFFIRLGGCNLRCKGCDTIYTGPDVAAMEVDPILARIAQLNQPKTLLVVITGGEPLRQDITPLLKALHREGFDTQIETNGTLPLSPNFPPHVDIVCSPKTHFIDPSLLKYGLKGLKYVLRAGEVATDGLPTAILESACPARPPEHYRGPIYVTPYDESDAAQNKLNLVAAAESCLVHGYTLQVQLHKLAELP